MTTLRCAGVLVRMAKPICWLVLTPDGLVRIPARPTSSDLNGGEDRPGAPRPHGLLPRLEAQQPSHQGSRNDYHDQGHRPVYGRVLRDVRCHG